MFTSRKPWWGGETNFGWKPPLHNSRNFISQRSTSHATQSFITPGEPRFPQLFSPCMVQLLARIISLRLESPNLDQRCKTIIIMGRMGICFTSWWGEACCLLLCFLTGTCVLRCTYSAVLNFDYLGECSHWGNRSTSHATQSFITPGEPRFPQLFCPYMVQLLAGIISLRRVLGANPARSHGSADTLPLRHSATLIKIPIILGGDQPWPSRSTLTRKWNFTPFWLFHTITCYPFKSKFIPFWACPHDNLSPAQARITKFVPEMHLSTVKIQGYWFGAW